jgi:cobalt-precorrin-5B (C1)-methyltransferase
VSALREGYTTGSCAAAATKAAVLLLVEGREIEAVEISLPDGQRRRLPLVHVRKTDEGAEAAVRKDAGDDPDVTNGALIEAAIVWTEGNDVEFAAGEGVGTVTKPGLAVPPGKPAVNPGPRRMIREAVREITPRGVRVTISIPGGLELAAKTFNPRLGITGGLSIVRPFSCSALRESLRCALDVAVATGTRAPVFVPGRIGERAARTLFRVTPEQVVGVGNEWGFSLDEAARRSFAELLAVGHPGKLAKLMGGGWDTHSGKSGSALPIVAEMHARILGRPAAAAPTVDGIFMALDVEEKRRMGNPLAAAVKEAIEARTGGRFAVAAVLIDLGGRILGSSGDLKPWQ